MHWHPTPVIFGSSGSPTECGAPPTPAGGVTVKPYNATTVSSVIVYQCQQSGFTPSPPNSVCGEDERWSPDPSQVVCEMIPGMLGRLPILLRSHSLWSATTVAPHQ